jgi:phage terminase large subunit-like protein
MAHPEPKARGEIRSAAHGRHWIAWIADAAGKPAGSVVLIGETREEVEERAQQYLQKHDRIPRLGA